MDWFCHTAMPARGATFQWWFDVGGSENLEPSWAGKPGEIR